MVRASVDQDRYGCLPIPSVFRIAFDSTAIRVIFAAFVVMLLPLRFLVSICDFWGARAVRDKALLLAVISALGVSELSAGAAEYGQNLIPNSSFESLEGGKPAGWYAHGPKGCCTWSAGTGLGGSGALSIAVGSVATAIWESEFIPLNGTSGGAEFSAWMKTENVLQGAQIWHKAGLRLAFYDQSGSMIKLVDLERDDGTHEWAHIGNSFLIPENAAKVKVGFYLSKATGKAWIDDISFRLFPKHVGKRLSRSPGDQALTINVDPSMSNGTSANLNGLLYENVKKRFADVKDLRTTLIRTPQVVTYYHLVKDVGGGKIKYEWSLLDRDIRQILDMGALPFISIGWVPEPFEKEIRNHDYTRWNAFIEALVTRYSRKYDTSQWYWNFWNEPSVYRDVGGKKNYINWAGTEAEFYRFYAETARAAHAANDKVKIGAAGFAANSPWLFRFIDWCGVNNVRLDFVSWHSYGTVPELLGEKIKRVQTALGRFASTQHAEMVMDEWSSYPEGGDERKSWLGSGVYAAAYRVAALEQMLASGLSANAWFNTYEDGFGVLAGGVRQPTYDSFQLVSLLGTRPVAVTGHRQDPYISALGALDADGNVGVLMSHFKHRSDLSPDQPKRLRIVVPGFGSNGMKYRLYRIDAETGGRAKSGGFAEAVFSEGIVSDSQDDVLRLDVNLKPNSVLLLKAYR